MKDIICYDTRGNPIEFLTQWDVNCALVIKDIELDPIPCVRFSNKSSKTAFVVKPTVVDGCLYVDIPNILLTQCYTIIVNIFYEFGDGSAGTRYIFSIPVIPAKMPEDYFLYDNVDYINWVSLQEEANALLDEIESEGIATIDVIISNEEPESFPVIWFDTTGY